MLKSATLICFLTAFFSIPSQLWAQGESMHLADARNIGGLRIDVEYLTMWTTGANLPPLVSTSPIGTARPDAGVLGTTGARTIFGGEAFGASDRPGTRLTIDMGINEEFAIIASGVYFGADPSDHFFASSDGSTILARPFTNSQTFTNDSELVAFPNVLAGSVEVSGSSEGYLGDIGLRRKFLSGSRGQLFGLMTYRHLGFTDSVGITEDLESIDLGGVVPLGTTFLVRDRFEASNYFNGLAMGGGITTSNSDWLLEFRSLLSLGSLDRRMAINGSTEVTVPSISPTTTVGGLLAQGTNIANYKSSTFVISPEFRLTAHRRITKSVSAAFGYTVLVMPEVWRAGNNVDPVVNTSQVGGGVLAGNARPSFTSNDSTLVMQGLTLGLSANW